MVLCVCVSARSSIFGQRRFLGCFRAFGAFRGFRIFRALDEVGFVIRFVIWRAAFLGLLCGQRCLEFFVGVGQRAFDQADNKFLLRQLAVIDLLEAGEIFLDALEQFLGYLKSSSR